MSAVAEVRGTGWRAADRRALAPATVASWSLAAMGLLAAMQWGVLLAPSSRGRLFACLLVALAAGTAARRLDGLPARPRAAAQAALALACFAAVLLAAGVALRLLDPRNWDDLAGGLGQGIGSLPAIGVPYRGLDPWIRIVLVAAGGVLLVLAAGLAVRALRRGRRPLGAALVLTAAYVVPVIERPPVHPFVWGMLFTLLLGALSLGDRIERGHAGAAAAFVVVALAGALVLSPRLDAAEPWLDYQGIVESLSTPPAVGFDWNHDYGPLTWPRENRVMLRVASDRPHYWKAVDLATFDGTRWVADGRIPSDGATEFAPGHADWRTRLRVTVRDLRSSSYVAAGTGLSISHSPRFALPSTPGTFATGRRPLRRGDSYGTEVYTPEPSLRELRNAGTAYPPLAGAYLSMELPPAVGGPDTNLPDAPSTLGSVRIEFPQFSVLSARTQPTGLDAAGGRYTDAASMVTSSQYAPMYRLARRLRDRAGTPYEYLRLVQARLSRGFAYTERPPAPRPGRPPLVSFLFDARAGYCQQFSGAMALLLRMGGVPARVSSGFSPGSFDEGRDEWVVRDVDAHSWVEAYFPQLGWVTFDPTPGVAPARTQLANAAEAVGARELSLRPGGRRADVPVRPGQGSGGGGRAGEGGIPVGTVILALLVAAALAAAVLLVGRRRRSRPDAVAGELAELERALRLTGRPIEPGLTLAALEERFRRHAPGAAAYVAAVRLGRYAGHPERPTAGQRSALRAELADGLGVAGRMRAWRALPPRGRRPRPV